MSFIFNALKRLEATFAEIVKDLKDSHGNKAEVYLASRPGLEGFITVELGHCEGITEWAQSSAGKLDRDVEVLFNAKITGTEVGDTDGLLQENFKILEKFQQKTAEDITLGAINPTEQFIVESFESSITQGNLNAGVKHNIEIKIRYKARIAEL